jgi:hypothetical protein
MSAQNQFEPHEHVRGQQQGLMLAELLMGEGVTTLYAREVMGISHPTGRVLELRRQGHAIITRRVSVADSCGRHHTMAAYYLATGGAE